MIEQKANDYWWVVAINGSSPGNCLKFHRSKIEFFLPENHLFAQSFNSILRFVYKNVSIDKIR